MVNPTERRLPAQISGDDVEIPINVVDDGDAVDISGYTFTMVLEKVDDGDQTAEHTETVSTHDNAANGETSINIAAADTSNLGGEYEYDLYYDDGTGVRKTFLYGRIEFIDKAEAR